MSNHNMFLLRNKKNINLIPLLSGAMKHSGGEW